MSIYDKRRAGKPINPAQALYNHLHQLLVGLPACDRDASGNYRARSTYGTDWFSASFSTWADELTTDPDRPPITYAGLTLFRNGTFNLSGWYGWKQRDAVARNTFLRWSHVHGEYVWWVDTTNADGNYGDRALMRFQDPVPYIAEKVMAGNNYLRPGPRLKLAWKGGAWQIAFAHEAIKPRSGQTPISMVDFERYEQLREKRYRRYEKAYQIATGTLPAPKPRRSEEEAEDAREERREAAVEAILANLSAGQTAKTTPLRKTTAHNH